MTDASSARPAPPNTRRRNCNLPRVAAPLLPPIPLALPPSPRRRLPAGFHDFVEEAGQGFYEDVGFGNDTAHCVGPDNGPCGAMGAGYMQAVSAARARMIENGGFYWQGVARAHKASPPPAARLTLPTQPPCVPPPHRPSPSLPLPPRPGE